MEQALTIFLYTFLFAAIVFFALRVFSDRQDDSSGKDASKYNYRRQKYFMSRAENECYQALIDAIGNEYYIFAQVHLPTIVDHTIKGQSWRGAFAHINRKSVDFVLCDKEYISPKLAIELDDSSHERTDRKKRDAEIERILEQAELPLLRIENKGSFDQRELQDLIKQHT